MIEVFLLTIYCVLLFLLLMYCSMELLLAIKYMRTYHKKLIDPPPLQEWPLVTIQLPVYNEYYVVQRLLMAVSQINYPKDKLEIQLLDDSTDESFEIGSKAIEKLVGAGYIAMQLKRTTRNGYKAGALSYGMEMAKGEYIAIFDADFIPDSNFLFDTLPYFYNDRVACVQTRWSHINKDYNLLTRVQAFFLDCHFTIQQSGRYKNGLFINFNGTAGIWRKSAILDAGDWSFDTLAEDLDLSYRAQLGGWEIVYLESILSPAEIPASIQAFKSQQYRWIKGGAETARKLTHSLCTKDINKTTKFYAFAHLYSSSIYIIILLMLFVSLPLLWYKNSYIEIEYKYYLIPFIISNIFIAISYYIATVQSVQKEKQPPLSEFITIFPLFLLYTMGLSLHNGWAALQGWVNIKSPFVRTPKYDLKNKTDKWQNKKYNNYKMNWSIVGEGLMMVYCIIAMVIAFYKNEFFIFPMHLLFCIGYGLIFFSQLHTINQYKSS